MGKLAIETSAGIMDATYFTRGDVEPTLAGDTLTVYEGTGRSRSWGRPQVWSTVLVEDDDLVTVHIGFNSKHGGGQFYRYYVPTVGRTWGQLEWRQLTDGLRRRVLDGHKAKAPTWAKAPGKLSTEKKAPVLATQTAYKIVRLTSDGRMLSLFDGETEYEIGKRLAQKAQDDHNGGYYSYRNAAGVKAKFLRGDLVPSRCYEDGMRVALLECEISGAIVTYEDDYNEYNEWGLLVPGDKFASTYLRPVRIVETFEYRAPVASH